MKDKIKEVVTLPKNEPIKERVIHLWCNQATMDAFNKALEEAAKKVL